MFPRFNCAPTRKYDKFVGFCCSESALYKTFHDFCIDIGPTSNGIMHNWKKLWYIPWHADFNPLPPVISVDTEEEEIPLNMHRDSREH